MRQSKQRDKLRAKRELLNLLSISLNAFFAGFIYREYWFSASNDSSRLVPFVNRSDRRWPVREKVTGHGQAPKRSNTAIGVARTGTEKTVLPQVFTRNRCKAFCHTRTRICTSFATLSPAGGAMTGSSITRIRLTVICVTSPFFSYPSRAPQFTFLWSRPFKTNPFCELA
jgi:hypothetical protein